jgi:hypothetical protein
MRGACARAQVLERMTIATAVLVAFIYRILALVVEEPATFQGEVT